MSPARAPHGNAAPWVLHGACSGAPGRGGAHLHQRDGVDRVRAAHVGRRDLRQPQVLHLALVHHRLRGRAASGPAGLLSRTANDPHVDAEHVPHTDSAEADTALLTMVPLHSPFHDMAWPAAGCARARRPCMRAFMPCMTSSSGVLDWEPCARRMRMSM